VPFSGRSVAFDLDGVLIDGMPFHVAAWEYAFGLYGVVVTRRELLLLEGVKSDEVVAHICMQQNADLNSTQRDDIVRTKRRSHRETFRVIPLPGAVELVELLRAFGHRLALVTGTTREAADKTLGCLGIASCFDCIVSSESVGAGKPSPEPYLQALSACDVAPDHCIAVENSPPGITSARAAGLACIAVASYLPAEDLCDAAHVFPDVVGAGDWLRMEHALSDGRGPWQVGLGRDAHVNGKGFG
jgi:HAD superfamily hydrolase (TIGR01509 family)